MSAIHMTCPHCDQFYIAGMVGSTPWPAHICPNQTPEERHEEFMRENAAWDHKVEDALSDLDQVIDE